MEIPQHLNEEFFNQVVKNFDFTLNTRDFHIEQLVANGSYCSRIYKARISYKQQTESDGNDEHDDNAPWHVLNFFVKELLESLTNYSKEHTMYAEILPDIEALIETKISPKVYWTEKNTTELHVFENLSLQGYDVCERLVGYDAAQTKAVLRKLAKYHAGSFVYTDKHRDFAATISGHFYSSDESLRAFTESVILANAKHAAAIVEQWPGYADIAQKMLQNTGDVFQRKLLKALDKKQAKLNIILHGDLWIRNIMMRKEADSEEWDAILLDYQNIFVGTPILDIANLLLTSVQLDVLQTQQDDLLRDYHATLVDTLRSLNYAEERIPSLQVLQEDLRTVAYYNYYLLMFPFAQTNLSNELADGADFNDFFNEEAQERNRKNIFSNPRVLDTFRFMLKRFDDMGLLDVATEGALPTYLNEELLVRSLQKAHNAAVTIVSSDYKLASKSGENYCSLIYRAHVVYECDGKSLEKHLLIKDMKMEVAALGSTETVMYNHILPGMEALTKTAAGQPIKLKADCHLIDRDGKELYVLEDLCAAGYSLGDRKVGLDEAHARVLLTKLGQYHAAGYLYVKQNAAEVQTQLKSHSFYPDPISAAIYHGGLTYVANLVTAWEHFDSIAIKLRANVPYFAPRLNRILKWEDANICVISHGDLWVTNFLYHYDEHQNPDDVIFIDYQSCSLGSPGFDINFFLYSSVQLEVLKTKRFELLQHYYVSFSNTLLQLSTDAVPSFECLLAEVDRLAYVGFYASTCELPYCAINDEAAEGFTSDTFGDEHTMALKRPLMYDANERVMNTLRYTLPYFDQLGVLD